jgi:hypothetical protein
MAAISNLFAVARLMATHIFPASRSSAVAHLELQIVLVPLVALVLWIVLVFEGEQAPLQTLALFVAVVSGGLAFITRLRRQLQDPSLQKLGYVFLVKLLMVLFVLYAGWTTQLNPASPSFGYDPQRFYFQAAELTQSKFAPETFRALNVNYPGIIFYYAAIFTLIGQNPVIPALVNTLVTLWATLLLVRVGYQIKRERGPRDWWLGLGMVIPEVIWFDALTARETLSMALVTIVSLAVAGYFIRRPGDRFTLRTAAVALPALLLLGVIRTSLLIPVAASLLLLFFTTRMTRRRRALGLGFVGLGAVIFLLAPLLSGSLGAYQFDYLSQLHWVTQRQDEFLSAFTWSERSIGQLFIPNSPLEMVLFAPVRILIYPAAPLPAINVSLSGLMQGQWSDWQSLLVALSSVLYLGVFPLALASLLASFRRERRVGLLAFHVPFWLIFGAVAVGNQIIQERYRLSAVLLLWGCVWLGIGSPKPLVRRIYILWLGLLGLGAAFYGVYKFLL